MVEKFPYGAAPFWLLIIAVSSSLLLAITRSERPPRPDLAMLTFTEAHYGAYAKVLPEFERKHNVKVQLQLTDWRALQSRLRNSMLAGTDVPDLVEVMAEGTLGFFTQGPREDIGLMDLTDKVRVVGLDRDLVASRFSLLTTRGRIYALPHDVHPMVLAYRRDLVEELGIDVERLDTWEKFAEVGRRISRDENGDGILDRYMLDLPQNGNWAMTALYLQRGGHLFDEQGRVAFDNQLLADLFVWYLRQTIGQQRIAYDCGFGQPFFQAMKDGLVLFFFTPDWRSFSYEHEMPSLKGKLALMPLPAWEPGGRRTSVWGGTGLLISKRTKHPELAWELAKFLYFTPEHLGQRFLETNIIPPLKTAWDLPAFHQPNPYFSNQPIGRIFAELAPETPPVHSAPVDSVARIKIDEAYARVIQHYKKQGEAGLMDKIREEIDRAAAYVRRMAKRGEVLVEGD